MRLLKELFAQDEIDGIVRVRKYMQSSIIQPYENTKSLTGDALELDRFQYYCQKTYNGALTKGLIQALNTLSQYMDDFTEALTLVSNRDKKEFDEQVIRFDQ